MFNTKENELLLLAIHIFSELRECQIKKRMYILIFSASLNRDIREFIAKKYFTDHRTANRGYFNHLLSVVPARSALFEERNTFFSTKNSKNMCRLGGSTF